MPAVQYEERVTGKDFESCRPLHPGKPPADCFLTDLPSPPAQGFYDRQCCRGIVELILSQKAQTEGLHGSNLRICSPCHSGFNQSFCPAAFGARLFAGKTGFILLLRV